MIRQRAFAAALLGTALMLAGGPALFAPDALAQGSESRKAKEQAPKGQSVRAELGRPLQAAQELTKTKKYKDALAKVKEADAVPDKTPYETFLVEETRGFVLMGMGDQGGAAKAFAAVVQSGQLADADRIKRTQAISQLYYQAKDYGAAASWAERFLKEAGPNAEMRTLLVQALYLKGDLPAAAKELNGLIAGQEKAGQKVPEEQLQLLAGIAVKQKDDVAYVAALERLVRHHPKADYWQDLILRVQKKPGFNRDRLTPDVFRLMQATGTLTGADDHVEMAELAMAGNNPGEAKAVLEKGFAAGILGQGKDAERHKRLLDLATRKAAEDRGTLAASEKSVEAAPTGGPAVRLGEAYAGHGQYQQAVLWLEKGLAKGGLKQPEDARLHLAIAQLMAGNGAAADKTFATVAGSDGAADLARLWRLIGAQAR